MIGDKLSLAVGGQSLAMLFLKKGGRSFGLRFKRRAPAAPGVKLWGFTMSGSVAASTNRPLDPAARASKPFWWDMERDEPSAAFSQGLASCAEYLDDPCECLLWDQGQSDAGAAEGAQGHNVDQVVADFAHATGRILQTWRAALAPADPNSIPIIMIPHAPHPLERRGGGSGVGRIRATQHALARAIPNCHDAGVIEGMALRDNLHPSTEGQITYSLHVAEVFARLVNGATIAPGAGHTAAAELSAAH